MQWIEDRFWVWIHYCASKIGRNEIFETIEAISFLRQTVTGPMALIKSGCLPRGVRRIESDAPQYLPRLKHTVAGHDALSCVKAIKNIIKLYRELRDGLRADQSRAAVRRAEAEKYAAEYLDGIEGQVKSGT